MRDRWASASYVLIMNAEWDICRDDAAYFRDGYRHFARALDEDGCCALEACLSHLPKGQAGVRVGALPDCGRFLAPMGRIGSIASRLLGTAAMPVRAVLFDKSPRANWSLGWHQDRTIVVRARHEVAGFGPWTRKAGLIQVEPPFALLERMVTIRIHLDLVDQANGPLRIIPGSHRLGRIAETHLERVVADRGEAVCLAARGDVWAYSTPIVHASASASGQRRRRVLQVDYSCDTLPSPLAWRGILE